MTFKELSESDKAEIEHYYNNKDLSKLEAQVTLADKFNVTPRAIRLWAKELELNTLYPSNPNKILIYDIETSRGVAKLWWSGKQYVNGNQFIEEPQIISIAWLWLGEDKIHELHWDMETHSDKEMMRKFLPIYNSAHMVVGQNNKQFDDRWVNARAYKHDFYVDVHIKSFDIMKQHKRMMRVPSYSMDFMTKFKGYTEKLKHEGIIMWDMIEDGTPKQQREYMDKMLTYGRGDIQSTKEMYLGILKYSNMPTHLGVLNGADKYSCPVCGGTDLELIKTITTPAGTIQRLVMCKKDQHVFKISNTLFLKNN